jgi:hypothetical protein
VGVLPAGAVARNLHILTPMAWFAAGAVTLSVGLTPLGSELAAGIDLKTVGRTDTAVPIAAMGPFSKDTPIYASVQGAAWVDHLTPNDLTVSSAAVPMVPGAPVGTLAGMAPGSTLMLLGASGRLTLAGYALFTGQSPATSGSFAETIRDINAAYPAPGYHDTTLVFTAGGGVVTVEAYGINAAPPIPANAQMISPGQLWTKINAAQPGDILGLNVGDWTDDVYNLTGVVKGNTGQPYVTIWGQPGCIARYIDTTGCVGIEMIGLSLNSTGGPTQIFITSGSHCRFAYISCEGNTDYPRAFMVRANAGPGTFVQDCEIVHCDFRHVYGFSVANYADPGTVRDVRITDNRIQHWGTDGALVMNATSLKFQRNIFYDCNDFGDHNDMFQTANTGLNTDTPYFDPITGKNVSVWVESNLAITELGSANGTAVQGIPFMGDAAAGVLVRYNCSWGCSANGGNFAGVDTGTVTANFWQAITGGPSWAPLTILQCPNLSVTNNQADHFSIDTQSDPSVFGNVLIPDAASNADTALRDAFIRQHSLPHSFTDYAIALANSPEVQAATPSSGQTIVALDYIARAA